MKCMKRSFGSFNRFRVVRGFSPRQQVHGIVCLAFMETAMKSAQGLGADLPATAGHQPRQVAI